MGLEDIYPVLKQLWVVWFVVLFAGIVFWAMRPSAQKRFDAMAKIPLREE